MGERDSVAAAGDGVCDERATVHRRPHGSGSIFKEGRGYRARLPGSARISVAYEPTYAAAAAKLDAALEAIGAAPSADATVSLWEWLDRCLAWREGEGLRNTAAERWQLDLHVRRDEIGAMPLALLEREPKRLREWLVRLRTKNGGGRGRTSGRGLGPSTIRNILTLVRDGFARAVSREVLATNPMMGVRLPRATGKKATTREEFPGVLEPDEQVALVAAAAAEPLFFRAMLFIALWTGIRRSELLQLRWENVFLDAVAPYMMVRFGAPTPKNAPGRGPGVTKSGKPRKVPLYGMALDLLREWRAEVRAGLARPEERLCVKRRGGKEKGALLFPSTRLTDARLKRAQALSSFADLNVRERRELRDVSHEIARALACDPPVEGGPEKDVHEAVPVDSHHVVVGVIGGVHGSALMGGGGFLEASAERAGQVRGHGLVFPGPRGERIKAPWAAFRRCLRRAGIARKVTWHDLRHTAATSLLEGWRGPPWTAEAVRQLCGHSDVRTTEKYLHARGHLVFAMARDTDVYFRDHLKT